jgi:ATP-dependent Clp protease ATP-binding subunit ClpA
MTTPSHPTDAPTPETPPTREAAMAANAVFICTRDRDTRENIAHALDAFATAAVERERERCANIAEVVQGRAAENAQELMMKPRSLTLEKMRELDNHLTGQRHAANEIARSIRAGEQP